MKAGSAMIAYAHNGNGTETADPESKYLQTPTPIAHVHKIQITINRTKLIFSDFYNLITITSTFICAEPKGGVFLPF